MIVSSSSCVLKLRTRTRKNDREEIKRDRTHDEISFVDRDGGRGRGGLSENIFSFLLVDSLQVLNKVDGRFVVMREDLEKQEAELHNHFVFAEANVKLMSDPFVARQNNQNRTQGTKDRLIVCTTLHQKRSRKKERGQERGQERDQERERKTKRDKPKEHPIVANGEKADFERVEALVDLSVGPKTESKERDEERSAIPTADTMDENSSIETCSGGAQDLNQGRDVKTRKFIF